MIALQTEKNGEWALLEAHLPGRPPEPIRILLRDAKKNRLHTRLKDRWWDIFPEDEDSEVWRELADDLEQRATEVGSAEIFDWLQTTASHCLQISARRTIRIFDVKTTLNSFFHQHICTSEGASRTALIVEFPRTEVLGTAAQYDPWYSVTWKYSFVVLSLLGSGFRGRQSHGWSLLFFQAFALDARGNTHVSKVEPRSTRAEG
jgi:hypothetical protein